MDERFRILLHAILQPLVQQAREGVAVKIADELFVARLNRQPGGLPVEIARHDLGRDLIDVLFKLCPVHGLKDVVDCASVFHNEAAAADEAFLPASGLLIVGDGALRLSVEQRLGELVQICIMVVKRPARDLTVLHNVRHCDLVERFFGKQLHKRTHDRIFGQMCHGVPPDAVQFSFPVYQIRKRFERNSVYFLREKQ